MNLSSGLLPGWVRTIVLIRKAGAEGYNGELDSKAGGDVADVPLYDVPGEVLDGAHTWFWHTWVLPKVATEEQSFTADALTGVCESRGPANVPIPGCANAYYRSDEDQTGASTTTAPVGGWDTEQILNSVDARLRSPDNLQVDNRL